jgi:hypothetical protein
MPDAVTISCSSDLANLFARGQYSIDKDLRMIDGWNGVWDGLIPSGGRFPLGSGYAARVTNMGQQRLNYGALNGWTPMVGLQADCAVSCDPPVQNLNFGNGENVWYRLMTKSYNTIPYCLETMVSEAMNLQENIQNIYTNLKHVTIDTMDEFYRSNHAAISQWRWAGYVNSAGQQSLLQQEWRFATDANGNIDPTYIILGSTVDPNNISLLSVRGLMNQIRDFGIPTGTFPVEGNVTVITDYTTFTDLPLYDTNTRADNRFRAPTVLNPEYASTMQYGGYQLKNDPFVMRYMWRGPGEVSGYPNGVLQRIDPWADLALTDGCMSNTSRDYQNADFQVSVMWGGPTFSTQSGEAPLSAPGGVNFSDPASPWNGVWRWVNEVNEITPCNVDRNKGFWRAVFKKAPKPMLNGFRGHLVLHKRFPWDGIQKLCRTLNSPTGGSADCSQQCNALDLYPPTLATVWTCGSFNADSCSSAS